MVKKFKDFDMDKHVIDTLNKYEDKPDIIVEEVIRKSPVPVPRYEGGATPKRKAKPYNAFDELVKQNKKEEEARQKNWSTNFRDDLEDNDWTYIEGIFATKNLQIISYQIRYSKLFPDIANHFSYMYDLKADAFEDWKKNNDSSYKFFVSWLENYPKKKKKI